MGLNFRKRIKILPGLTMNIGKRGTSVTVGGRGASVNFGKSGVYGNVGVPGTGVSYRERLDKPKTNRNSRGSYASSANPPLPQVGQGRGKKSVAQMQMSDLNEPQASGMMWFLLIALFIGAGVIFYNCFTTNFSSPGTLLIGWTFAAVLFSLSCAFLGISINIKRKKESPLGINMGATALLLVAITFFIWSAFWPETSYYYRTVWVSKVRETVNLGGWVTFGRIMSGLGIVVSFILYYLGSRETSNDE
ncbi:MAG: DUF4236 domain-containing protein [Muribaculum sp.]|nr:DUF4236 domain-containing protein [Muribaculum sp.]